MVTVSGGHALLEIRSALSPVALVQPVLPATRPATVAARAGSGALAAPAGQGI
jgi:hypothetical protein